MRPQLVIPALLSFAFACQADLGFDEDTVGQNRQASVGGTASTLEHHEAVAAITILRPLKENDPDTLMRMEKRYCTGILVGEKLVMTLATCMFRNVEAELEKLEPDSEDDDLYLDELSVKVQFGTSASAGTEYYLDATVNDGVKSTLGVTMHRYYDENAPGTNDVALLSLTVAPPGITPAKVNSKALSDALVDEPLELVGYGKKTDDGAEEEFTSRKVVSPLIEGVSYTRVEAGTEEVTTCFADSGGPGFYDFGTGDGPEVVTVNVFHRECAAGIRRQRADRFASDFVQPFIDFQAGCTDCEPCDYNGVCEEVCPTRDWDCAVGVFTGLACNKNGDCEEGGTCVPAGDDPTFTYCSKSCDAEEPNACPSTMVCDSATNTCIYDGISPGSQGADCSIPSDCRSGFCENLLCAAECDASNPSACDTANGFACLPSTDDGQTTVCRTEDQTGGGGFCSIRPAGRAGSTSKTGAWGLFGMLFLLGLFFRRK